MTEPEKLRDHVAFGTPDEVSAYLSQACADFERLAAEVWKKVHLQDAARILPNLLRCIARQLQILNSSSTLPIEVAAGACRTVFELNIRTRLIAQEPQLMREFWSERVFEQISLIEAFKRLTHAETSPETLKPLNDRVDELRRHAAKGNLKKPSTESTFKMAERVGLGDEYKALYGFYSKYTHGTAWLVNSQDADRDGPGYRTTLLVHTQVYAFDAKQRIEKLVEHLETSPTQR